MADAVDGLMELSTRVGKNTGWHIFVFVTFYYNKTPIYMNFNACDTCHDAQLCNFCVLMHMTTYAYLSEIAISSYVMGHDCSSGK